MPSGHSPLDDKFWMDALDAGYEVLASGWPDFLIVKDERVTFVEVKPSLDKYVPVSKADRQAITPLQLRLLRVLERLGLTVRISLDGDINNLLELDDPRVRKSNVDRIENRRAINEFLQRKERRGA